GHEDVLKMERGIQTYLGYPYSDRLHLVTHHHNQALIPRERMFGVRGRIDVFGEEVLPLREEDARQAAAGLLDAGVEGIVISLLFGYRNGEHEQRVAEIVREEIARRDLDGAAPPIYLASELYPQRRDLPRLNSTVVEAYAAEPSRGTLRAVAQRTREAGAGFELRVMASHGGTISIEAGCGSFVRVNPNSLRPELGPDSAGASIGVCWPEGGLETISVTDLNLVLGRVNPDYFLGGEVKLDVERARGAVQEQLAEPL